MTYNDQIIIQEYTQARDTLGAIDDGSWATYKTVWANIEDINSNANNDAGMRIYEDSKSFTIHTPDAPNVTTKMRISYDSQIFVISSINKMGRLHSKLIATAWDDE